MTTKKTVLIAVSTLLLGVLAAIMVIHANGKIASTPDTRKAVKTPSTAPVDNRTYIEHDSLLRLHIGQAMPPFDKLKDVEGNSIEQESLTGKSILVEYFSTNCGACWITASEVASIDSTYSGRGLKTMLVDCNLNSPSYKIKNFGIKNRLLNKIHTGAYMQATNLGITGFPTFFLMNSKGVIVYARLGLHRDELVSAIEKLLNEKGR